MQVLLTENIRQFRRARQMTQEQLAEVLGVTVGTVSKWESGSSTPDLALIMDCLLYTSLYFPIVKYNSSCPSTLCFVCRI